MILGAERSRMRPRQGRVLTTEVTESTEREGRGETETEENENENENDSYSGR